MREIKFRGYDGADWIYGSAVRYDNYTDTWYLLENGAPDDDWVMVGNIGQFTGLKDKNGTKVYESDIVKVSEEYGGHAYTPLVVDFKNCCFVLRRINYMADYHPMFKYDFTQVYEVIGNIHENPELLEA